jgi:hypothetical protein
MYPSLGMVTSKQLDGMLFVVLGVEIAANVP